MKSIPINEFSIDTEIDPYKKSKQLVFYLDNKVKESQFTAFIQFFSEKLNIPENVVSFEIKQYLMRNHNFKLGKFKKIFNLNKIFISSIIYCLSIFYIFLNSKKKNKKELCDIIFDEIESKEEISRVLNIKKKFKSFKIISSNHELTNNDIFCFSKYKDCDREYLFSNYHFFGLNFLIKSLTYSISEKTNYIDLATYIIKKTIKYHSIFGQVQGQFLYQERHYTTSAIKNYLFKHHGGKVVSCFQKNLIHLHDTGFYVTTDILFSLGKKTTLTMKFCGSKIKKIIPVGSIFLETKWFKSKKTKVPKHDIIVFVGNNTLNFATNKEFKKNYIEHLKWIVNISNDFPNLKVAIKHHFNNKNIDNEEREIIKNSKVKTIMSDNKGDKNYSYGYAFNSVFACTFVSTIAYELIGHNKSCFFLDPNGKNLEFLNKEKYNEKWKIKSYKEFKEKVEKIVIKKKKENIINRQDFCILSKNVANKISSHLRK